MGFIEFLKINYIWILVVLILLIITIIGFFADRRDKKKNKKDNKKTIDDAPLEMPNFINTTTTDVINNEVQKEPINIINDINTNTSEFNQAPVNDMIESNINMNINANNNFGANYGTNINERPNLSTFSSVNITGPSTNSKQVLPKENFENKVVEESINTTLINEETQNQQNSFNNEQVISGWDMPHPEVSNNEPINNINQINEPNVNLGKETDVPTVDSIKDLKTINEESIPEIKEPIINSWDMPHPEVSNNELINNINQVNEPNVNLVKETDIPTVNSIKDSKTINEESIPEIKEPIINSWDMPHPEASNNEPINNINQINEPNVNLGKETEIPTVDSIKDSKTINEESISKTIDNNNHPIFAGINLNVQTPEKIDMPNQASETNDNQNNNIAPNENTDDQLLVDDDIWKL